MEEHAMKVAVYTYKGGVGKTAIATALGSCPAFRGGPRVILSMDPQGDMPYALGLYGTPQASASAASFQAWVRGIRLSPVQAQAMAVPLPQDAGTMLVVNGSALEGVSACALKARLNADGGADSCPIVCMDLPPRETAVSALGVAAADFVLAPVVLDEYAPVAAARTAAAVRRMAEAAGVPVPPVWIVLNRVRTPWDTAALEASKALADWTEGRPGARLLASCIRDRAIVRLCGTKRRLIWQLTPFHGRDIQSDVLELAAEIKDAAKEEGYGKD